jgi:hypothetical protein
VDLSNPPVKIIQVIDDHYFLTGFVMADGSIRVVWEQEIPRRKFRRKDF